MSSFPDLIARDDREAGLFEGFSYGGHRAVRDSKDPAGPALTFTPTEWTAFTAGVRAGELG